MASLMHALPSGPEDGNGLSNSGTTALDLEDAAVIGGADPARPDIADWFGGVPAGARDKDPRSSQRLSLRHHLAAGDAVALTVAWVPFALVASGAGRGQQLLSAAAAIVTTMAAMRRAGLYQSHVCALASRQVARVLASTALGAAVFAACGWLTGSVPGGAALAGAAIGAVLILALRWRFGRWLKGRRSAGQYLRTTVLLGTNDDAIALWTMLSEEPELGYRIAGVVGERRRRAPWQGLPVCVDTHDLPSLAQQTGADGVIVVAGALPADAISEAVNRALAAGLHVQIWPGFMGFSSTRVRFAPVSGMPAFYVEPPGAAAWQQMIKRAIDIAVTAAVLPLAAPVLIAAAICIKLEDGGRVIYHHSVIGRYGAPTTVLKLRTMVPNAAQLMADVEAMNERTGGPLFKASNDPRVTKIGRILRASSIDELPQLWNVLTGRMSLVGPRFALPREVAHFDAELQRRHQMRPGITGLWQTEARDNPSFSAYRRLDLQYVDNWSLGLDLAILANTAHAVSVRALKAILPTPARHHAENDSVVPSLAVPELATVEPISPE